MPPPAEGSGARAGGGAAAAGFGAGAEVAVGARAGAGAGAGVRDFSVGEGFEAGLEEKERDGAARERPPKALRRRAIV